MGQKPRIRNVYQGIMALLTVLFQCYVQRAGSEAPDQELVSRNYGFVNCFVPVLCPEELGQKPRIRNLFQGIMALLTVLFQCCVRTAGLEAPDQERASRFSLTSKHGLKPDIGARMRVEIW